MDFNKNYCILLKPFVPFQVPNIKFSSGLYILLIHLANNKFVITNQMLRWQFRSPWLKEFLQNIWKYKLKAGLNYILLPLFIFVRRRKNEFHIWIGLAENYSPVFLSTNCRSWNKRPCVLFTQIHSTIYWTHITIHIVSQYTQKRITLAPLTIFIV